MKKCPKCKELNPDSCNICESCGTMLDLKVQNSAALHPGERDFEHTVNGQLKNIIAEVRNLSDATETIKKCVIFFVVLTVISMAFTFISLINILSKFF